MTDIDDGGPAFPTAPYGNYVGDNGMTLRQWYAGQALQGMLANNEEIPPFKERDEVTEYFARSAYEYADAMLKAGKE